MVRAAGLMLESSTTGRSLFLKRSQGSDHAGTWCFPGGGIEGDESPLDAALRELHEETGYKYGPAGCTEKHKMIRDGVEFTTFHRPVGDEFNPELNDEHTEFLWAPIDAPPSPLHPGVQSVLSTFAMDSILRLALDKESVRQKSADGHLHVAVSNISKAAVNPYVGKEIPNWEGLGLDPDKIYKLLRDPEELAKSASSFNGKPVLAQHQPVSSDDHPYENVIGSTGTDAVFDAPFLKNSIVLWAKPGIDVVESGDQRELSCGYRYTADMTPGVFEGTAYDGVMRDIVGNHIALVKEGRAGRDVVVGDSNQEVSKMSKIVFNAASLAALGLVTAFVTPKLAMDAKPINLIPAFAHKERGDILKAITSELNGKLAKDASLDGLVELLDKVGAKKEEGQDEPADISENVAVMPGSTALEDSTMDNDPVAKIKAMLEAMGVDPAIIAKVDEVAGGEVAEAATDEDMTAEEKAAKAKELADKTAKDENDKEEKDAMAKQAQDAAITAAVATAVDKAVSSVTKSVTDRLNAVATARANVQPWVGEVGMGMDTAEQVYRATAKALGIEDHATLPAAALWPVIKVQPNSASRQRAQERTHVALDSNAAVEMATHTPFLDKIQIM